MKNWKPFAAGMLLVAVVASILAFWPRDLDATSNADRARSIRYMSGSNDAVAYGTATLALGATETIGVGLGNVLNVQCTAAEVPSENPTSKLVCWKSAPQEIKIAAPSASPTINVYWIAWGTKL